MSYQDEIPFDDPSELIGIGDVVRCLVSYYKSYYYGEDAVVKNIVYDPNYNRKYLILDNHLSDYGDSRYSIDNWKLVKKAPRKEKKMPAYEKTKYFGVRLTDEETGRFVPLDREQMTVLRDHKTQVLQDIKDHIQQGERWMVLQTVMMVEPEEPKPPLRITEYK